MPRMSRNAERVPRSGIREIVNLVASRPDDDIVRLEIGEPGFATPAHIVEAGNAQAVAGARYTQSAGTLELRTEVADKLARVNGIDTDVERVVVCQGAVQGCSAVLAALLEPGDEVLIPDPAWPNYEMLVLLHGGIPVAYGVDATRGFMPDLDEIDRLVTDRTVAIVMNSPGNPTGAVFGRDVVAGMVDLARRANLTLLSDEVYDELVFDGVPANAPALDGDHVVGLYSFSKTYAMTGWRVGYLTAPAWLAPTVAKLQEPLLSCISAVSQAGALAALRGPQECVVRMRDEYRERRDLAVSLLLDAGIATQVPGGAFYLMVPLAAGADARRAALELVDAGVATAPGTAFGTRAGDHLRVSLASPAADLREGLARLAKWHEATSGGAHLCAEQRAHA